MLWIALAVNAGMFAIEIGAGLVARSVSLQADALDFFGDAANYGISLMVLGQGLRTRASAALLKGISMGLFGAWVVGQAIYNAFHETVPSALVMGWVGVLALAANVGCAYLLYTFRGGDANMRSVWLCSRNDAIGNVAVLLAAAGVFGIGTAWPDLAVAGVMAVLALSGAVQVVNRSVQELRYTARPSAAE